MIIKIITERYGSASRVKLNKQAAIALKRALRDNPDRFHSLEGHVPAGVLVPLFHTGANNDLGVLMIKRTGLVRDHKDQISFPGGVAEPGESPTNTALREAGEEIGLPGEEVEVLGLMKPVSTMTTGYMVHPVVGLIPYPFDFRPDPREVAAIVTAPLSYVENMDNWTLNPHPQFQIGGHLVWGATARIILKFLDLIQGK